MPIVAVAHVNIVVDLGALRLALAANKLELVKKQAEFPPVLSKTRAHDEHRRD